MDFGIETIALNDFRGPYADQGMLLPKPLHYQPLPSGSYIRLFSFSGSWDCLALETVSLEDVTGQYDTLSYVWGPESRTEHVTINQQDLVLRNNLCGFLKELCPK